MESSPQMAPRSASDRAPLARSHSGDSLFVLRLFVLTVPLISVVVFYKIQPSFVVGFVGLLGLTVRKLHGGVPKPLRVFFWVAVVSSCMSFAVPHVGSFMGETPFLKSFKQIFQLGFMIALLGWIVSTVDTQ